MEASLNRSEDELVFTSGASRQVSLRDVESALSELWTAADEETGLREQGALLRVRELNLVVFAGTEEAAEAVGEVVAKLAQRHPARAIVLVTEAAGGARGGEPRGGEPRGDAEEAAAPDQREALHAWITAACRLAPEGERNLCWEQVTIPAFGSAAGWLPEAVAPLLVPDLPVVLWWLGSPDYGSDSFRRLSDLCDSLVIDLAGSEDSVSGLIETARLAQEEGREFGVTDLNWTRLTPWREIIAELFDEPSRRTMLGEIESVSVSYRSDSPSDAPAPAAARALLLVGWLGSRLGWSVTGRAWEPVGGGTDRVTEEGEVELRTELTGVTGMSLRLRRKPSSADASGGVWAIDIEGRRATDAAASCLLSINRAGGGTVCVARARQVGREGVLRSQEWKALPVDQLLSAELDFLEPDRIYEDALIFAARLAALPGSDGLWR